MVEKVVAGIRANGGRWADEREQRRQALVKDLREAARKQESVFVAVEDLPRKDPGLTALTAHITCCVSRANQT